MMRVEGKWSFPDASQTRHGVRKRRKGRGFLAARRAADRAGARGGGGAGSSPAQTPEGRRTGAVGAGEGGPATQSSCGGRVLRSRRYRRPFEDKPIKRLFTPEIKRFLKGWLVRRRENPYPSREEKKELSRQTALTYVQICNWFANWRRKLKNAAEEAGLPNGGGDVDENTEGDREDSGPEDEGAGGDDAPERGRGRTWGNLIRRYNSRAHGNVEQFSITSDDSIWEEPEESVDVEEEEEYGDHGGEPRRRRGGGRQDPRSSDDARPSPSSGEEEGEAGGGAEEDWPTVEHSYSILLDRPKGTAGRHRRFPARKPGDREGGGRRRKRRAFGVRQGYARKGSCEVTSSSSGSDSEGGDERGRRGLRCPGGGVVVVGDERPSTVTKWLESAYAFDERKMNFSSVVDAGGTSLQLKWAARNVTWPTGDGKSAERTSWILSRVGVDAVQDESCRWSVAGRHKEELDAAEALARLSATASP